MKLRELVDGLNIPPSKLTEYALNPDNERGQHKARVFLGVLGYTAENYHKLLTQIQSTALDAEITIIRQDIHGIHLHTDLKVEGIANQTALIHIGWLIATGSRQARLVTLYVRKERG